ncbi:MAG: DUF5678 domain-containing protein [Blastocatellia bacterium]
MSVELVETIKQQAAGLTPREKSQLGHYLLEQATLDQGLRPGTSSQHETEVQRLRQLEWLKTHREEYAGQYVALDGDRLVGQGRTMAEAHQQARQNGVEQPFLMRMTSEDEILPGGW